MWEETTRVCDAIISENAMQTHAHRLHVCRARAVEFVVITSRKSIVQAKQNHFVQSRCCLLWCSKIMIGTWILTKVSSTFPFMVHGGIQLVTCSWTGHRMNRTWV